MRTEEEEEEEDEGEAEEEEHPVRYRGRGPSRARGDCRRRMQEVERWQAGHAHQLGCRRGRRPHGGC